jgi:hypothetical protein
MEVCKALARSRLGLEQEPVAGLGAREAAETLASPRGEASVVEALEVLS